MKYKSELPVMNKRDVVLFSGSADEPVVNVDWVEWNGKKFVLEPQLVQGKPCPTCGKKVGRQRKGGVKRERTVGG